MITSNSKLTFMMHYLYNADSHELCQNHKSETQQHRYHRDNQEKKITKEGRLFQKDMP